MAMDAEYVDLGGAEKENQYVHNYTAPWEIYSIAFSSRAAYPYRLGIGSIINDSDNYVEVVQLNPESRKLEKKFQFDHKFAPTKIMWVPDTMNNAPDLMATSGEMLRVYNIENNERAVLKCELTSNKKELMAPLTSFDWNSQTLNMVITCSIDTTCSIWDISQQSLIRTLIAHDKEVLDVSFSPEPQMFATVGADGSVRHFDIRDLSKSDILYEMSHFLVRVAWNKNNKHYVAVVAMDDNSVTLLDTRKHSTPLSRLAFHKGPVNHLAWAPHSGYHICSVSDDMQALIWDLKKISPEIKAPLLEYMAQGEISNLSWGLQESDWIALCFGKQLQILRVY